MFIYTCWFCVYEFLRRQNISKTRKSKIAALFCSDIISLAGVHLYVQTADNKNKITKILFHDRD